MSARFGRKKRLKARLTIAALEHKKAELEMGMAMDRSLLRNQSERLQDALDEIERAKELAAPYSALFKPATIETEQNPPHDTRDGRYWVWKPEPVAMTMVSEELTARDVQRIPLDVFLGTVDKDYLDMSCHAWLKYLDGSTAYAISRKAMLNESPGGIARILQAVLPEMIAGLYKQAGITPQQKSRR